MNKKLKILAAILFVAIAILSILFSIKKSQNFTYSPSDKSAKKTTLLNPLEKNIINALREFKVPDTLIDNSFVLETESKEINVIVPKGKPMEPLFALIINGAKSTSYSVEDSYYSSKRDKGRIFFTSPKKNREDIAVNLKRAKNTYFSKTSNLIIIINGIDTVSPETRVNFLNYNSPLSYNVSVYSNNLDSIHKVLTLYDLPYIVSIPLESKKRTKSSLYSIRLDDSKEGINSKLNELVKHLPSTVGIKGIGGDLLLNNSNSTNLLFSTLKKRGWVFFESRRKNIKKARSIANSKRIKYIYSYKTINGKTVYEIENQLNRIAQKATRSKKIIVFSDATDSLLVALDNSEKLFKKVGITFSTVKDLK